MTLAVSLFSETPIWYKWKFYPGVFGVLLGSEEVHYLILLSVRVKDHSKDWSIPFKNGWNEVLKSFTANVTLENSDILQTTIEVVEKATPYVNEEICELLLSCMVPTLWCYSRSFHQSVPCTSYITKNPDTYQPLLARKCSELLVLLLPSEENNPKACHHLRSRRQLSANVPDLPCDMGDM